VNPEDSVSTHHVHDDQLPRYILGRLSEAEVDVLEHHVFQCPDCKGRLDTTARIVAQLVRIHRDSRGPNNRSEARFRISDPAFLRSLSPLLAHRWPVQVLDFSKNGVGLLVPTHLSPDGLVQVQIGKTFALGEVRYSRQIGEHQFHTGVRLQDVLGLREK
jgi:anti-sigma factor RsiW